jgi:RimJ/RimL family protein N-acetyltransferase
MQDYLTDGRISLRKYRIGDDVALYAAVCESIHELSRWGFYHVGFTLEDAAEDIISRITTWNQGEKYTFLVEELPCPVFVGNCSVEEIDFERQHASLGWWVRTSRTGRGIATAAGSLAAQAAFEHLQFSVLRVYTNAENIVSRRVAEKIGAVLMKIKPEDNGRYCAVYELKPEYLKLE